MLCFALAGAFFYETLQQRLLERVDRSLDERLASVREVFEVSGIEGVVDIARQRDRLPMQNSMGFHLSEGGRRIAGNVPVGPLEKGWSVVRGSELGLDDDGGRYRILTTTLGGYDLSLGKSLYAWEELRAVALNCLLWTLAGSTLLAIAVSAFIARRMQRRIWGLSEAIGRVALGDLDARIPLSGRCDDIDGMSATINDALDRLSRSVDGMRQVSTDIAHDLKTPLNRLYIQLEEAAGRVDLHRHARREERDGTAVTLGAGGRDRDAGEAVGDTDEDTDGDTDGDGDGRGIGEALEMALEEARGIDATFEALLRIAQIEAGARRARFDTFDLGAVLTTVAEIYEPVTEESGQSLQLDLAPDASLPVHGDRELVTQLLVNLVENAIHHGDGRVAIRIEAGADGLGAQGGAWFRRQRRRAGHSRGRARAGVPSPVTGSNAAARHAARDSG